MPKTKIKKAKGQLLHPVWLILSDEKAKFEDKIALVDLFIPRTIFKFPNDVTLSPILRRIKVAQYLWETLSEKGFQLNSDLERNYRNQLTCLWCGGPIITYQSGESWEVRCDDCNYMYEED